MRAVTTKNAAFRLACLLILFLWNSEALKMTVQVTVIPSTSSVISLPLPLCKLPLLQSLRSLLTNWVVQSTKSYVSDFNMPRPLTLTYYNPSHGRMRRTKTAAKKSSTATPQSCSTCSSSGCSQYCGRASCTLCNKNRRHLASSGEMPPFHNSTTSSFDIVEDQLETSRELDMVNFVTLGPQVSASVLSLAQTFLLNNLFDVLGCLGSPLDLNINVTFLVNQIFNP